MPERAVLVTGAEGYLGGAIAEALLERTARPVLLLIHDRGNDAAERVRRLRDRLDRGRGRTEVVAGELREPSPLAGLDPRRVGAIVHAAAVTRFNVDAETADAVNVGGAARLADFARRCPELQSFVLLSSLYASGLRGGRIPETPLAAAGFANEYERSKHAAEAALYPEMRLPWQILRVGTVIADSPQGGVSQHNVFHNTLKLFFHGLLSTLPGCPGTPLYVTSAERVVEATLQALGAPPFGVWHVCGERGETPTLARLVDLALEVFRGEESFRRRNVPRPLFMDATAFAILSESVARFSGPVVREAMASIGPFAPQLFVDKDVVARRLRAALPGTAPASHDALVVRACEALLRSAWRLPRVA